MISFPDIETILMDLIEQNLSLSTGIVTPGGVENKLPFVAVRRIPGGGDDGITDIAVVDIDVYASSRAEARSTSESVRNLFNEPALTSPAGLDTVRTTTSPGQMPEDNTRLVRYHATYRVTTRRQ